MKISCNNFKMQKIIEGNCKTLCIKNFLFFVFFLFVMSIYLIYLLFKILYNLYFLLNPLENNPGAATGPKVSVFSSLFLLFLFWFMWAFYFCFESCGWLVQLFDRMSVRTIHSWNSVTGCSLLLVLVVMVLVHANYNISILFPFICVQL